MWSETHICFCWPNLNTLSKCSWSLYFMPYHPRHDLLQFGNLHLHVSCVYKLYMHSSIYSWTIFAAFQLKLPHIDWTDILLSTLYNESLPRPPEGVARYCFDPVCLYVCVSVCPANILVFYFSAIRRDMDLKFTGMYIAFWRYSHITKPEP